MPSITGAQASHTSVRVFGIQTDRNLLLPCGEAYHDQHAYDETSWEVAEWPLSDEEQRLLEQMEAASPLRTPSWSTLSGTSTRKVHRRRAPRLLAWDSLQASGSSSQASRSIRS